MTDRADADPGDTWEVVAAKPYDPGNPAGGAEETPIVRGPESEARRVYRDTTAEAAHHGYERVMLRHNGADVEVWPQATGWTV